MQRRKYHRLGYIGIGVARHEWSPSCPPYQERNELRTHPLCFLLSSYGREQIAREAESEDIEDIILKPVTPSKLYNVIAALFGKTDQKSNVNTLLPTDIEFANILKGTHVLVVEDNDINQQVALGLLQSVGMIATIANNGAEALEKVFSNSYDMVLMDCQMPVMDGYTATEKIREDERFATLPIIAISANTMTGDRDKCLKAGMNDHVAKPIEPADLYTTLIKWKPHTNPDAVSGDGDRNEPKSSAVDALEIPAIKGIDTLNGLRRVGGNTELYLFLLGKLATYYSDVAQDLTALVNSGKTEEATLLAHSLKGSAGNLGAMELYESAQIVESMLLNNQPGLDEAITDISKIVAPLIEAIMSAHLKYAPTEAPHETDASISCTQAIQYLRDALIALKKNQPKPAKEALYQLESYSWDLSARSMLNLANRKLSKYDFLETQIYIEQLLNFLEEDTLGK